ncbi:hypothetical protein B0H19DRAFT_1247766 [Mycena capillaripes]|nr:hypothetical protein B0H19DRAFT_1247766 [Mycena capillaripes]
MVDTSPEAIEPTELGKQLILFTGPLLIGIIIDWMLQGTLIVQLYLYYAANRKDPILLKIVVYGVFILDTIQTLFATVDTWNMLVVRWGNPDIVAHPFWAGGLLDVYLNLPVSISVQFFFAWRVYTLKPTRIVLCVSGFIVSVGIIQCVAALVLSTLFIADPPNQSRLILPNDLWLAGTLVTDFTITVAMVVVLWGVKTSSSQFETTSQVIMRLIVLSIEVGAPTVFVAAAELFISQSWPQSFLYLVPTWIIGKLATNALLISLNARGYIRGPANRTASSHSGIQMKPRLVYSGTRMNTTLSAATIHIATDTVTDDNLDRKGLAGHSSV